MPAFMEEPAHSTAKKNVDHDFCLDLLCVSTDRAELDDFKHNELMKPLGCFNCYDKGPVKTYLSIQVDGDRDRRVTKLHQTDYAIIVAVKI